MLPLTTIIRKNISDLKPYSSARSEFTGNAAVFLDANENNYGSAAGNYNRYPDPLQQTLKQKISDIKKIPAAQIFIGNGSDEPIDLLIRATCNPGIDNVVTIAPTYGMYEVSAAINDVAVRKVLLNDQFQPEEAALLAAVDEHTKLMFLCSPNNPTGNLLAPAVIESLLINFSGLLILDEAYIDFAADKSWLGRLSEFPNLIVLQTFSKAWGLAGLRLGMAFASSAIIGILNKIKLPYNISMPVQELALASLDNEARMKKWVLQINKARIALTAQLAPFVFVQKVFASDANFLLLRVSDAGHLHHYLAQQGIVVRNRHGMPLCDHCLRISIGTPDENAVLVQALKNYSL